VVKKEIVEASPEDKFGYWFYSTNFSWDTSKATNWFEAIMQVRETHVKN
jgi:hypothetical protein